MRLPVALLALAAASGALAQIAADGALGTAVSRAGTAWTIGAGTQRGGNLFHSFTRFSVPTGQSATFTGPGSVDNVIARVTGSSGSFIDGTLRSEIPRASLWLINPNGVEFGANARLELQGSFHVATADYLKLRETGRFDASTPGASRLTSAPPSAFGFVRAPAPIQVTGASLRVPAGSELSLAGGAVDLNQGSLSAPGGMVRAASVASAGELALTADGFEARDIAGFGALTLNASRVSSDSSGSPAGRIFILGGSLSMDRSAIESDNSTAGAGRGIAVALTGDLTLDRESGITSVTSGSGRAGSITLAAGGKVSLLRRSVISSGAEYLATGDAGDIDLSAGDILLTDFSEISTGTQGYGKGGAISLNARGGVVIDNASISADTTLQFDPLVGENPPGAGDGGTISVSATDVRLIDSGISTFTFSSGAGGNISIAADRVHMTSSGIFLNTVRSGNAGKASITTGDLLMDRDSYISGSTSAGTGRAADIAIDASRSVRISGEQISFYGFRMTFEDMHENVGGLISASEFFPNGNYGDAGSITVRTPSLVLDGTLITSTSFTRGSGGNVTLDVGSLELKNGAIVAAATLGGGDGGTVRVTADGTVSISDVGRRDTELAAGIHGGSWGAGRAGSVAVSAASIVLQGGVITSTANGRGDAGDVDVSAGRIELARGGSFSTDTRGGAGGHLTVLAGTFEAAGRNDIRNPRGAPSGLYSRTRGAGDGGTIVIDADRIVLRDGATISASSSASGDAGSISASAADTLRLSGGATITTEAASAAGGGIAIRVGKLVHLTDSAITTSVAAGGGNGGDITIDPVFVVLDRSRVSANAVDGNGGNIGIVTQFFISRDSVVEATSRLGISGTVAISTPQVDLGSGMVVLSSRFFDAASMLRPLCGLRAESANSFVLAGQGGIAEPPQSRQPAGTPQASAAYAECGASPASLR